MWLYLILGILGLLVGGFIWGLVRIRHGYAQSEQEIAKVRLEDIPALAQRCANVFKESFNETLDLNDFETSARNLSGRLDQHETLKAPFATDDFYWRFVLHTGAFLGELIRVHAGGSWAHDDEGGAPIMKVATREGDVTTYPLDKILKHMQVGDRGDIYAFLHTSLRMDEVVADVAKDAEPGE